MERSTYVLVASLCLALAIWQWRSVPDVVWAVEGDAGRYALYGLYGLGWAIALLSSFLINHFDLFGLQQVYYHWRGRDMPAHSYRTPLLYRVVRHPLMLGLAIVFWAVPTMSVGHLIFSVGMTLYILVGIQFEERDLVRAFGDDYRAYRRRTSMLIPMPPRADNR
jgi:protein-S-isoprenylcysteine O-methyltransferase Ste14